MIWKLEFRIANLLGYLLNSQLEIPISKFPGTYVTYEMAL